VEKRLGILSKLLGSEGSISEDEWNVIVYYGSLHNDQRTSFKEAQENYRSDDSDLSMTAKLSP